MTSSPVGATVIVNGQQQGVTPLEISLARKMKGQVIRIESPGYNSLEIRPQRKMAGGPIIGNFLMGLIPGLGVAALYGLESSEGGPGWAGIWLLSAAAFGGLFTLIDSSGKGYMLNPEELTVTLKKSDGTPRIDTMLIDADDLRNVKWIRVRRE